MRDTNHESRVTSQSFDPPTPSTLFLSGSKSLGITFGSGQNLSLDQSLRVNITGRVEDVEVNAVLSDENTLLQPEGTTETLESLDEVLVEIKSTSGGLSATLGDYNLSLGESEFGRVERRLQGGMAGAQFSRGSVLLAGAISRGKFATDRFFGVEGRQGPYPLVGKDGEREIVVIAGSEKIYLDEILLIRGERNGYTIDYSSAELTFTPRHLITSRSRILVEFEYFTGEYRRSLYGGRGTSQFKISNSKLAFGTTFFREGDSPNSPIGVSLSDEDRAALSIAGDDTSKAWVSGAALVDSGLGDYVQKGDTFEFVGYQQGNYLVTFTDVGDGNGEYEFIGNGFQFVGPDSGRYVPRIRLPLPNRKSFLAFDLSGEIAEGVQVRGEVAGSERDLNVLSSRDDGDNIGKAGSISFDLNPEAGLLPGSWGRLGLKGKFRSVEERFEYPGRGRNLQYEDRWNVKVGRGKENLGEVTVSYGPFETVKFFGEVGRLRRNDGSHTRQGIGGEWKPKALPSFSYRIERVESSDLSISQSSNSRRTRQTFKTDYSFWRLKPQFTFFQEDSISYRFRDFQSQWSLVEWGSFSGYLKGGLEKEDQFQKPHSTAKTGGMGISLGRWRSISGSFDLTHREKTFEGSGTRDDKKFDLASLRLQFHPILESRVEVTSTQSRFQEERFFQVADSTGGYSLDTLTGEYYPDPEGNFRREILFGDSLSVHRLQTSLRFDYSPDPRLRLEGYASLDEERKDSRLWDISKFQDDSATLQGATNLEGEITLYPEKYYSLRLRVRRLDDEDNQILNFHRERLRTERSIQVRSRALEKTVLTANFALRKDEQSSTERGVERVIQERDFTGEVTYKPRPQWEPSLRLGYKIEDVDELSYGETRITSLSSTPGLLYHLLRSGRLSARLKLTDRRSTSQGVPPDVLIFSPIGFTTEALLDFDYRLNEYITARIAYQGIWEPDRDPRHSASTELRAFF